MPVDIPESATEKWDKIAAKVKRAQGGWVLVVESSVLGGTNERVVKALERRGIAANVVSRKGNGESRPWQGWRTWARVK